MLMNLLSFLLSFSFLEKGIVVLVVTDDEALLEQVQESFRAAGVVATLLPRGYGTTRILTELQQAWLLGYGDICIVSAVSYIFAFSARCYFRRYCTRWFCRTLDFEFLNGFLKRFAV